MFVLLVDSASRDFNLTFTAPEDNRYYSMIIVIMIIIRCYHSTTIYLLYSLGTFLTQLRRYKLVNQICNRVSRALCD